MNTKSGPGSETAEPVLVITRVVNAPRELVWQAMTDPQQVVQWWGPNGFTTTIHEMDVRRAGVWRHTMHGPDGTDYPNRCVFREVVKPDHIIFSNSGGKKGDPDVGFEATWTFESMDKTSTRVTIRMVFPSILDRDRVVKEYGAVEGGNQTLARLEEYLEKSPAMRRTVVLVRAIEAPRSLVFRAWTDADILRQWWGPKGFTNPVCEIDARIGGAWRIVMRSPDGSEYPCGGTYKEIVPNQRLVFTNIATDKDANPILDGLTTVTFEQVSGKTKLTLETSAVAMVAYAAEYLKGMEAGWSQSLDRLADQVAKGR